jgi:hypothetical protein
VEARKRLVKAAYEWQTASSAAAAPAVNVVCDIILGTSGEERLAAWLSSSGQLHATGHACS